MIYVVCPNNTSEMAKGSILNYEVLVEDADRLGFALTDVLRTAAATSRWTCSPLFYASQR